MYKLVLFFPVQFRENNSEVSSDSETEEILNQARAKLQTLEDEVEEIEDKFKYFHYV